MNVARKMRVQMLGAFCATLAAGLLLPQNGFSAALPGAADAGRIKPEERYPILDHSKDVGMEVKQQSSAIEIPKDAKKIPFTLHSVKIEGATVFSQEELAEIYKPYIDKKQTLDIVWIITGKITQKYRDEGYFLSRAYVPEQRMDSGNLTIKVVEGYIGEVELNDPLADQRVVREYIDELLSHKPMAVSVLESFLLRLNDLPDAEFRTVMTPFQPKDNMPEGAVKLALIPVKKQYKASADFDNYSSRFLGPNELSFNYSDHFLPLQQTSVSLLSATTVDELHYGTIDHSIIIAPELTLDFTAGITKAQPGYTLKDFDIKSDSRSAGVNLQWQAIRQRDQNLSFKLGTDMRNTINNIAGSPLTRDKIRAVRGSATFDFTDPSGGYTSSNLEISRGLSGLGSSDSNDPFISRAAADPDFTKAVMGITHFRRLTDEIIVLASLKGQVASKALYSSEEYGYGGQAFGRAYDSSELTGDQGISESIELRYSLSDPTDMVRLTPYVFYDNGTIWNIDAGQPKRASGSSGGGGVLFDTEYAVNGNLGLAFPLSKDTATPIYGADSDGPRVLLQVSKDF